MIGFTEDELMLMIIYNPGTKEGLVRELTTMQQALTGRDRNLRKWTKGALEKLGQITDEEYEEISRRDKTIYGDNKDEVEDLFKKVETDERLKEFAPDLMRVMISLAQVRHLAILTMIDDDVYDIGSAKFEDLKRIYDESNARVRYFTPEEEPQLTQKTVLIDVDDESIIQAYETSYIHQKESKDLTSDFFNEVKGKPYTLKRK